MKRQGRPGVEERLDAGLEVLRRVEWEGAAVTGYELKGKPLVAYKRRRRKKRA